MLFFELFPAVFAVVALIVGVILFAINHRARDEAEPPRAPSRPEVDPDAVPPRPNNSRRPSMRA